MYKENYYWRGKYPVLVIAHRGFSGQAPENTMAAFKMAVEAGAEMIELDVHLTSDSKVVVIHDDFLERTTNGSGRVADYTFHELEEFDSGSWFSKEFRGEKIPSLCQVLSFSKGRILINIEIKKGFLGKYSMNDLADRVLEEVESRSMLDEVLFSSFEPAALRRIREKSKDARIALLLKKPWKDSGEALSGNYSILNCAKDSLTEEGIVSAKQSGFRLNVWTVNETQDMDWFIKMNVDGIITNYPDRLIKRLEI